MIAMLSTGPRMCERTRGIDIGSDLTCRRVVTEETRQLDMDVPRKSSTVTDGTQLVIEPYRPDDVVEGLSDRG